MRYFMEKKLSNAGVLASSGWRL